MSLARLLLLALACLSSPVCAQLRWRHADLFEGRDGLVGAFDAARERLVVFGGRAGLALFAETWEWDGTTWTRRAPAHSPPARRAHAMVYDPSRGHVLLFGGIDGTYVRFDDMWAWDGEDWTRLFPVRAPQARAGHDLAWDSIRGRAVLFGGHDASGYLNDTWEWDGLAWTERMPAHRPPPRSGGALTFVAHRGRTFLFSGACPFGGPCAYRDAWEWDGVDWTEVPAVFPTFGRWGHRVVYDAARRRVVTFGGSDEPAHYYDDTWEWDGSSWQQVVPARNVPGREAYAMAYDPRLASVILTGGVGWNGAVYSDVWRFHGDTWSRSFDGAPTSRQAPAMTFDHARGRVVMFGGIYGGGETWEWDGRSWWNAEPAVAPPWTGYAQMAFDPVRRTSWLVAGWSAFELWGWDGSSWRRTVTPVSPPAGDGHAVAWDEARGELVLLSAGSGATPSETWTFDGTDWRRRQPAHAPTARARHALAYDAARERMVLFGGDDGSYTLLGDTWEWDGTDWRQRLPVHAPAAQHEHRLVYDAARRRTVLLGWMPSTEHTVFEWDGEDWRAREVSAGPDLGAPAAVFDPARRELVVFTGTTAETWWLGPTQPADYFSFGSGCRGGNGVPRLAPAPGDLPWLGEPFTVDLDNLPPSPFLLLFLGASRTRWGPVTLPVGLEHLGMPGCTLWASGDLAIPLVSAGGCARWTTQLPSESALAGAAFYNQSWQIDWTANPGLATTSNACEGRLGSK